MCSVKVVRQDGGMTIWFRTYNAAGPMDNWQDQPEAAEISAEEFERLWTEARRALGNSA